MSEINNGLTCRNVTCNRSLETLQQEKTYGVMKDVSEFKFRPLGCRAYMYLI
jgi:hypothetical protein